MPRACIAAISAAEASNPSTSYILTSRRAEAFGGLASCHCHDTFGPGCQQPGQATGDESLVAGRGRSDRAPAPVAHIPTNTTHATVTGETPAPHGASIGPPTGRP